jgi:hypothetical protein
MKSSGNLRLAFGWIGLALVASTGNSWAQPKVPLKPQLKARVQEFGSAYMKGDWPALLELMAPFVRECTTADQLRAGWNRDSPTPKLLSWRLKSIDYNSLYVGEQLHVECTNRTYRVQAAAAVTVSQVIEKQGSEERGENYFRWVLIDSTWFCVGPD